MPSMPTVGIDWSPTTAPFSAPSWESLAARVRSFNIKRGRNTELSLYQAGTASSLCSNTDRALDPNYTAGAWFGNILPERYMRYQATYNSITYDLFYGYTDGYPQSYPESGMDSVVQLNATDGMKLLSVDLVDQYEAQMRTDAPTHRWRCDEQKVVAGTAITVADCGSGTLCNGTLQLTTDVQGSPIRLGSEGSLIVTTPQKDPGADPRVTANVAARPSSTTLWSFEGWWSTTGNGPASGFDGCFFMVGDDNQYNSTTNPTVSLWLSYGANIQARMFNAGAGEVGNVTASGAAYTTFDTKTHHFVVTYSGTNTRFRLYIDGALVGTDSTGIPATFTFGSLSFCFGGSSDDVTSKTGWWTGLMSDFAVYDGVELTSTQVANHFTAGSTGNSGSATGTVAGVLLDQVGWPAGRRTISTGAVNVGVFSTDGDALDILKTLARTEGGISTLSEFYIECDGNFMWRDRNALTSDVRSTTSQATFTDGAGGFSYTDIVIDGGNEVDIRNDVTITRNGGQPQHVSDATSITAYTKHTYSESGSYDQTDATALTKATAILARFKDPKMRITEITIMPGADPDNLYPQVLGRKIGDRITVKRTPMGLGTAISQDCWIDGIEHDVTPELWVTKFQLIACS